ncbi:MAG: T9SS type A sorting domain-containing protein [Bacteroidia bacterium]|nr:T9SS type A sorting domain-containing protein [Bacteroidia bacterium]
MRFYIFTILLIVTQSIYGQGGFKRQFKLPYSLNNTTKNVFETTPGNYLVCGIVVDTLNGFQTNRLAIMGLNSQGQLQWVKKYGNYKFEYLDNSLIAKWFYKEGNFIYHAGCVRDSNNKYIGVFIKFNFNGDTIWQKRFYDLSNYVIPQMVTGSVDNGFLITGMFEDPINPNRTVLLIKTDINGNELWRKKIPKAIPNLHDAKVILQDSVTKKIITAGYQYVGNASSYTGYPSILILDSLGNKLSQHSYTGPGLFTDLIQTKDKKFIAVGAEKQSLMVGALETYKSFAVKFDINTPYSPLWYLSHDKTTPSNAFNTVSLTKNNDVLIGGTLDTMLLYNSPSVNLNRITRVNKDGFVVTDRYYNYNPFPINQSYYMSPMSLNLTSDGGYISALQISNQTPNPYFIVKYDSTLCDSSVFYCQTVGLEELKSNNYKLKIYPNPAKDVLNIASEELLAIETTTIKITDVLGRSVLELQGSQQINIKELKNGIYFLQLYNKEKLIAVEKVIKE